MQTGEMHMTGRNFSLTVSKVLQNIWTVISRHLQQVVPHNPEQPRRNHGDL